jgi:uncharacterized membrane protein
MRIISVILTFIGFVLCFFGSVGVQYFLRKTIENLLDEKGAAGIGTVARGFDNAMLSSYITIFGSVIILLGLLFGIISIFTDKRRLAV